MSDTTRRFSRSLSESFADTRAACIETPRGHHITFHGHMKPTPTRRVVYLDNSLIARVVRWWRAFILNRRSPL